MSVLGNLSQILRQLENCSGTLEKIEILTTYSTNEPFKRMLWWALNPYKKFGLKNLPFAATQLGNPPSSANWGDVDEFLTRASNRQVTGDALREECQQLLKCLVPAQREVVRRVILKDLRCGLGATLVNKAIPGLIPEFGIMLAQPLEEKHIKRLQKEAFVYFQPKKNGDRSAHVINEGQAYSRNGHEQLNYGHITKALTEVCRRAQSEFTFDGEVINADFWGTRKVKKLAGNEAGNAVLHVFDIVEASDWAESSTETYNIRRKKLKNIWDYVSPEMPLVRVPSYRIKGSDVTWELVEEWRHKFVEAGDEGLIIRLDTPYNFKTRNSLFKRKVMMEGDFMIMEIREGEAGKKYEDMAAKILVDLGKGESCEVGLKGDIETRKELWKHRNKYVGMMCEVHFQEWTECEDGYKKLQFGVMHKIREDKS